MWPFKKKVTYQHHEIDHSKMRTQSLLWCPKCGTYSVYPIIGCRNPQHVPNPAASKRGLYGNKSE